MNELELRERVAYLENILRTNPNQLEIRMSLHDFHCKKAIWINELMQGKGNIFDLVVKDMYETLMLEIKHEK